jgi:hypothetical protein
MWVKEKLHVIDQKGICQPKNLYVLRRSYSYDPNDNDSHPCAAKHWPVYRKRTGK